jgi:holin-like protein
MHREERIPGKGFSVGRQWLRGLRAAPGFIILAAAFMAGEWLKARLGLIVPGNILGLFLLLGLLLSGGLPVRWVEDAAGALLWLLPLLFLPIFAVSAEDKGFWRQSGASFFAATFLGVVALWGAVGRMAQFLLRRSDHKQEPP